MRNHLRTAVAFVAGIVVSASTLAFAQAQRASALPTSNTTVTITTDTAGKVLSVSEREPVMLSSEALGLKISGTHHGRVVGTLMAKLDGQWVEIQFAPQDSFAGR